VARWLCSEVCEALLPVVQIGSESANFITVVILGPYSSHPTLGIHSLAGGNLNRDIASLDLILLGPSCNVTEMDLVLIIDILWQM
jgi:hypothetical protein